MKYILSIAFCLQWVFPLLAQESILNCTDSSYCVPAVTGMPRTKGIIIRQERIMDYGIRSNSKSDMLRSGSGQVSSNRRWEFKLRLPIISKPNFAIAAGIHYNVEEYKFEPPQNEEYPLYKSLEDKSLKSIGGSIYVVKPWRGKRYFLLRASGDLNGDYGADGISKKNFLQFSIAPLIGWKANDNTSYAFGFAYGYNFGRPVISPLISYNHTFNKHWGLETMLPTKVKVRYSLNEKTLFFASTELNGARYNIRLADSVLAKRGNFYLQKAEIRYLISFEREIHDWLWFGLEAGLRSNINFSLSDKTGPARNALIRNQLNHAMLVSFSLFAVAPRKFLKTRN
ncbi:hypothetical protein GXP67_32680 [Rhodocytophaga rosea]|uniref:DUF6268 domain-containing protein n=1 Tax=Rhodocytophaga rosea TaxID=2704465 RepID=A0A6C0GUQ2_9BACT|nr:DUF6268 family outer membrane beta-barrel protein [Rhodocytophaga rosea]QHT71072.1 hypothetical protein GXP67_32680 [Rhodocytophaga rosea]